MANVFFNDFLLKLFIYNMRLNKKVLKGHKLENALRHF